MDWWIWYLLGLFTIPIYIVVDFVVVLIIWLVIYEIFLEDKK